MENSSNQHHQINNAKLLSTNSEWKMVTLDDVCEYITDGKHGDCQPERNSGYYFISAKDIKDGTIDYGNVREITYGDFVETNKRTRLEIGDVLLSNSGSIGKIAIATDEQRTPRTTFQKSVAILKPKRDLISSCFSPEKERYRVCDDSARRF